MNSKEGKALKVLMFFVVIVALGHAFTHIFVFETNLSITKTVGLSGLAIGETNSDAIENEIKNNGNLKLPSMIIIIAEWALLFSLIALSSIRTRIANSIQNATHVEVIQKKNKSDTEIDMLYEFLKKNKKVTVSKVAELFKVEKKLVEKWGEILENNSLAVVDYPRFGEIEIRLVDEKAH